MNNLPLSPYGARPSAAQLAWHRLETYGFIHFTTNTFTDLEWGYGDERPEVFQPAALDARQWARAAKDGGLQGLILTCKHHDGFCLWPSRFTEHSVKNSHWQDGRGDVVRALAEACRVFGLKFGIYLSPWDRNHPLYGQAGYVEYYRSQLSELLTEYGPVFEVWHDGANGGDGWYGGARETRRIDRASYYGWPETWALVRRLQPEAVIFSDAGPDLRWVGNEAGVGAETTWCTFNPEGRYPGFPEIADLGSGHENGAQWVPPETDVSIRPGWFYHAREDEAVKSVRELVDIYFQSVGRGTSLLLNLPPDRRGLIHEIDAARLVEFHRVLESAFAHDLAAGAVRMGEAALAASSTRGPAYTPERLVDGDPDTCWATENGTREAEISLEFNGPVTFNIFQAQEAIAYGQRLRRWRLEAQAPDGHWQLAAAGTTIGYKRLARFAPVTARRVRLRLDDCLAYPALTMIGLFNETEI